jgi:hypothetical protein
MVKAVALVKQFAFGIYNAFLPLSSVGILCPDANLMSSLGHTKNISFRLCRNAEPGVGLAGKLKTSIKSEFGPSRA